MARKVGVVTAVTVRPDKAVSVAVVNRIGATLVQTAPELAADVPPEIQGRCCNPAMCCWRPSPERHVGPVASGALAARDQAGAVPAVQAELRITGYLTIDLADTEH